nr:hypothetical protein [Bradyrhizobium sp. 197]
MQPKQPVRPRRRIKQTSSLADRLQASAASAASDAIMLSDGPEREALLKKARLAEAGARINAWLTSPTPTRQHAKREER